jgi:hypothetical protein
MQTAWARNVEFSPTRLEKCDPSPKYVFFLCFNGKFFRVRMALKLARRLELGNTACLLLARTASAVTPLVKTYGSCCSKQVLNSQACERLSSDVFHIVSL